MTDTRALPEWIGATPDTPVPRRVKLRVLAANEGRCYLTGREIRPGGGAGSVNKPAVTKAQAQRMVEEVRSWTCKTCDTMVEDEGDHCRACAAYWADVAAGLFDEPDDLLASDEDWP